MVCFRGYVMRMDVILFVILKLHYCLFTETLFTISCSVPNVVVLYALCTNKIDFVRYVSVIIFLHAVCFFLLQVDKLMKNLVVLLSK